MHVLHTLLLFKLHCLSHGAVLEASKDGEHLFDIRLLNLVLTLDFV